MADFNLTDEQLIFIKTALQGKNILVDACIGSGKTTVIQKLCDLFPRDKQIIYLTYNKLLKLDAKSRIKNPNATVTNYHGFSYGILKKSGVCVSRSDMIQTFNRMKPSLPHCDILILDEYQDIELELANMLEYIKSTNPQMQIIAVGDIRQKIYDRSTLDILGFIKDFLGEYTRIEFTKCFRLSAPLAEKLGRIWGKQIVGVNDNCTVEDMHISQVAELLAQYEPKDILCLGSRECDMAQVLNYLEQHYPEKFNKKTVYASIKDYDSGGKIEPKKNSAIFTTYDSSKGLERKICVVFDYTEDYWHTRMKIPQQSYEILRNIFCVASSRGKERIIFVKSGSDLLSEETISQKDDKKISFKNMQISSMFDFKYKENIEECFSLLDIERITPYDDCSEIKIKTNDELIDLSPCVGNYQEAVFFYNHNIDLYIEVLSKLYGKTMPSVQNLSLDEKILLLTSIETKQNRYKTQVATPFVSENEKSLLVNRLSTMLSRDEKTQISCKIDFAQQENGEKLFSAIGYADVVKDNVVYELKFVSELSREHFLQCACYIVALGLDRGVLWNTRNNEMYEVSVFNKNLFLDAIARAITKNCLHKYHKPQRECFAVIDVETTFNNEAMSIGIVLADENTYSAIQGKYFILEPESKAGGMYSYKLRQSVPYPTIVCTRQQAISEITSMLAKHAVKSIFAYNAPFDRSRLHELSDYTWYDIIPIAANKHYNSSIPADAECFSNGKLKRGYTAEDIFRMLSGNESYEEDHNAILDAIDELEIMKLLGQKIDVYYENCAIRSNITTNKSTSLQTAFPKKIKSIIIEDAEEMPTNTSRSPNVFQRIKKLINHRMKNEDHRG